MSSWTSISRHLDKDKGRGKLRKKHIERYKRDKAVKFSRKRRT